MPQEEPNPFECMETLAEIAAFVHYKFGADALRECLTMGNCLTREFLEDAADELAEVGINKAAAIVADIAASAPSEGNICFCPYPQWEFADC